MSRTPQAEARRRKRLARRNGDRQFFRAVNRLRRNEIDQWQVENNPEKMKKRLAQLTYQAIKRQKKQEARDAMVKG
ncbi:hypothetical protein SEA_JACOREN57_57 [Mycobacterium phage JacoRen57]|nr:hypothetical protein SEA_JACOREN57_57 [Mycobacterium phage JacoRen57]